MHTKRLAVCTFLSVFLCGATVAAAKRYKVTLKAGGTLGRARE